MGENITAIYGDHLSDVPAGYNFDYVNADALIHKFSATAGHLTTASGMNYRVLALDPRARQMSLPVLKEIAELVEAGAIVAGDKPQATPSLADNHAEFHALADKLWGSGDRAAVGKRTSRRPDRLAILAAASFMLFASATSSGRGRLNRPCRFNPIFDSSAENAGLSWRQVLELSA